MVSVVYHFTSNKHLTLRSLMPGSDVKINGSKRSFATY